MRLWCRSLTALTFLVGSAAVAFAAPQGFAGGVIHSGAAPGQAGGHAQSRWHGQQAAPISRLLRAPPGAPNAGPAPVWRGAHGLGGWRLAPPVAASHQPAGRWSHGASHGRWAQGAHRGWRDGGWRDGGWRDGGWRRPSSRVLSLAGSDVTNSRPLYIDPPLTPTATFAIAPQIIVVGAPQPAPRVRVIRGPGSQAEAARAAGRTVWRDEKGRLWREF